MHEKISEVTILTIIISTILLVLLGSIIISFLFAYQRKTHRHAQELLILNETFHKTLLLSKLEIQEQTLDHIAKELHANVSQLTSVININLSTYLQQAGSSADENIKEAKQLVKQLMSEIKVLSVTLNTEHVGRAGFHKMLENEVERLRKTKHYEIDYSHQGHRYSLGPEKEVILFRLCQEILNNIVKHAAADRIEVVLHYEESNLYIRIADNGVGFNVAQTEENAGKTNSTGLSNIHSRCKHINGQILITSKKGQGTTIEVKIPI